MSDQPLIQIEANELSDEIKMILYARFKNAVGQKAFSSLENVVKEQGAESGTALIIDFISQQKNLNIEHAPQMFLDEAYNTCLWIAHLQRTGN